MKHYYYAVNDQQFGPFSIEELKSKRLKKSTLVWIDGMQEWATADSFNELQDILISEPPPLPKKHISSPIIETVQIKHIPTPIPPTSAKYDLTYEKETDTTYFGLLLFIVPFVIKLSGLLTFNTEESYIQSIAFFAITALFIRIVVAFLVYNIALRQNRNSNAWACFGFLFPSIVLIVIGQLKKLRLKIELDGSLPVNQQVVFLFEKANELFKANRYSESIDIINKAIEFDNQNFDCIKLRALSYYQLKNYENAKLDFETIINNDKFISVANFYLGNIAFNNYNRVLAIEYWLKAKDFQNIDAEIKLDLYHTFTQNYIFEASQIKRKLGVKAELPFISYRLTKYLSGLNQILQDVNLQFQNVQFNEYSNGIDIDFNKIFNSIHIAIAFYEIEDIIYNEADKQFQLHLVDDNIIIFSYDYLKDENKGLKKLSLIFKEKTGLTPSSLLVLN